jgi:PKD repeat protein
MKKKGRGREEAKKNIIKKSLSAVMAVVLVSSVLIVSMPLAAADISSFTISPDTGSPGDVSAYEAMLTTTEEFEDLTVELPAGFGAQAPTSGGVQVARVDLWNNTQYYGYATFTANNADPSNKLDVHADIGGDTADATIDVDYSAGGTTHVGSPFPGGAAYADLRLPTDLEDGRLKVSLPMGMRDFSVAIEEIVKNPTECGDYKFYVQVNTDVDWFTVRIRNQPPIASFTYSPEKPFVTQTATFDASSSYDPDPGGYIVKYEWDFGDGTDGTGMITTHLYSFAWIYTVNLTVTDDRGAKNFTSKTIEVREAKPTVSIFTNKKEYHPWDIMMTTIHLENPTENAQQVIFAWYLFFPDTGNWTKIMVEEIPLTPRYDEYFLMPLKIVNWPSVEFNATWYVAFYNATTHELISVDAAEWRYVPQHRMAKGERVVGAEEIAKEIKLSFKRTALSKTEIANFDFIIIQRFFIIRLRREHHKLQMGLWRRNRNDNNESLLIRRYLRGEPNSDRG